MRIGIVHYHLRPGGVTSVITDGVRGLLTHWEDVSIRLITGSREDTDRVLRSIGAASDSRVEVRVHPQVGYHDQDAPLPDATRIEEIRRILTTEAGECDLLWVHNYHLGKNPAFTEALLRTIDDLPSRRFLLHIHDFPESGRYQNLASLHLVTRSPLYPTGPNVRYALINRRDLRILREAGIPADRLFLLENPYHPLPPPTLTDPRPVLLTRLAPHLSPATPLHLSPIRTIRRKNVLEGALLSRLLSPDALYAVSLPGTSQQETAYSELVEACYREGLIRGLFPLGPLAEQVGLPFPTTLHAADLLVSSSVQEGFGYLFIQALDVGKPLLARRLDILEGFEEIFTDYPAFLYSDVRIPASLVDTHLIPIPELAEAYRRKLRTITPLLPPSLGESLDAQLREEFESSAIDFSYLPVPAQKALLHLITETPHTLESIRTANATLLEQAAETLTRPLPPDTRDRLARFSLEAHLVTLARILESYTLPATPDPPHPEGIPDQVLHAFARKEYLRLLYDF
ncbi:glycosyltransferase family 1 protein [Spirochaeta thermophila]|uniref:Uncharacterized protein n=1 Tax=Winmispira thermophila (strain ATCC 49972 / DSM 6192 / RI 19.B1) TaxID=665571 RepID=E0RNK9_WINT6|nr:glycosyltransferase family 1 protein [Spirochaeta thermophila]ADN02600.1 hypothetical protein STHERM_c16620 [Spirochaeta thermophila DSM 6192]